MRNSILQLSASLLICELLLTPVAGQQSTQQKSDSGFSIACGDKAEDIARFKERLKQDPQSSLASFLKDRIQRFASRNFNPQLQSYYQEADASKLDQLIETGEDFLSGAPDNVYVIGHLAFAMQRGLQQGFYKDIDKSKTYTERALKFLESPTPPPGFESANFAEFRSFLLSWLKK